MLDAMLAVGFSQDEVDKIFMAVSATLNIGNLTFAVDSGTDTVSLDSQDARMRGTWAQEGLRSGLQLGLGFRLRLRVMAMIESAVRLRLRV